MAKQIHILYLLILSLMMTSCEEDFILQRNSFKPSVVVNALFTAGSPFSINLTYSRDILDSRTKIQPIENAFVTIIERGTGREIVLKHISEGNYFFEYYQCKTDKIYDLIVDVPGYEKITATSNSPRKADVVNVITEIVSIEGVPVQKINFEIQNNSSNFYIWNFFRANKDNPLDNTTYRTPDKLINSINNFRDLASQIKVNSNIKDYVVSPSSGLYANSFYMTNVEDDGESSPIKESKQYLRVMTVSNELYSYYKSVEKYLDDQKHNASFSQIPQIYSNISGGLGVFAGYTQKYVEIK